MPSHGNALRHGFESVTLARGDHLVGLGIISYIATHRQRLIDLIGKLSGGADGLLVPVGQRYGCAGFSE